MVAVTLERQPVSTAAVQLAGWLDAADSIDRLADAYDDAETRSTFRMLAATLRAEGEQLLAADAARERFLIGAQGA